MYDFYGSFEIFFSCNNMRNINYVFLCLTANKSADVDSPDTSPATLAKHYKTLHSLYKRKIQITRMSLISWIWNL